MAALRSIGRRPTLWVELAVLAAWLALLLGEGVARGGGGGTGWSSGAPWICPLGLGPGGHSGPHGTPSPSIASASPLTGTPMWGSMALAMMVPTAMPAMQHAARTSLYWRRRRAAGEFLAVFLGLWTAFSLLAFAPLTSWPAVGSRFALPVALATAAIWQLTPLKLRALRACHLSRPLPPRGWRATLGVGDFALRNGTACLASCWAMMGAAAISGAGRLLWMAGMTGAMCAEKLAEKPLAASRRLAVLLFAAAIGSAAAALLP